MVRIQLRRDTAANWTSSNPVLRAGEVGIETDTLKFKVGNGTSTWTQITAYANVTPTSLTSSLASYIETADLGQPSGPAQLTSNGDLLIPENEVIMWSADTHTYTTKITATEPTANRTITIKDGSGTVAFTSDIPSNTDSLSEGTTNKYFTDERAQDAAASALAAGTHTNITVTYNDSANSISLAAAPGYVDEQAVDAVAAALAAGTHTNISVSYNDNGNAISLTGAQTYSDENAQDAVGNALGTGLSYNDTTGAISVDTTAIQARVADVSDTEIGYLNGVTSAIQTQLNDKAPINSPTFTGTVGGITKSMVGLGNVDNTTDANKPVSTATQTALDGKLSLSGGVMTGAITLSADPTSDLHAATKQYVDASTAGLNVHASVKAATTSHINLANQVEAGDILDGVTLANGNRILVKNQNAPEDNGVYIVANNGAPTRATDYNTVGEVDAGDFIFVESGTANAKTGWIQTNTITTLGTDPIAFTQFSGAGTYSANNGLTLTGNVFSINTGITADLTTAQTLTNKTLTSPTITGTGAIAGVFTGNLTGDVTGNVSGNAGTVTNGVYTTGSYSNPSWITGLGWSKISSTPTTLSGYGITDALSSSTAASTYLTQSNAASTYLTQSTASSTYAPINNPTFTGTVAGITKSMVGLGNVENTALSTWAGSTNLTTLGTIATGTWSATTIALNKGGTGATTQSGAANAILPTQTSNTGKYLTTNGTDVSWATVDALPSQTGNSGKYLTTNGSTASWATLVVPIETGTATVSSNTATTVDTTALSAFTSIEYMVSLQQGSKIRTSKVIVQDDGTSVDMTEFAITETGGTMSGVVISAAVSSTNAVLQVTVTDAASTNVTVKFSKVKL